MPAFVLAVFHRWWAVQGWSSLEKTDLLTQYCSLHKEKVEERGTLRLENLDNTAQQLT